MEHLKYLQILREPIQNTGIPWTPNILDRFNKYLSLLLEERKKQRIIGTSDPNEIINFHFLDSIQPLNVKTPERENLWLDIGTGAGLPGIPLSILNPHSPIFLLETSHKRASFLRKVKMELSLKKLEVLEGRAEEFAHKTEYRERFEVVLARALAPLPVLIELSLPFLKPGGYLLAMKGPKSEEEISESSEALEKLGGVVEPSFKYTLGESHSHLKIIPIKKIGNSQANYPRKAGIPQKRPLKP